MEGVSRRLVLGSMAAAVVTGCAESAGRPSAAPPARGPASATPSPSRQPSARPTRRPQDVGRLAPNELGTVPVLMFHRVADPVIGEYDITPDALWALLVRLEAEGYRPVRLADLVRRRFSVPRGRTPVVLTFDDSSPGQFHRFATGGIDPRSAVGVLSAFAKKFPHFRPTATLFLNAHPFADDATASALQTLVRDGFELGNHTLDHVNLGTVGAADGQRDIAALQTLVRTAVPGLRPVSFSLPYGVWPADRTVPVSGTYAGETYRHEAVCLVGSNPAPSPYSTFWDPAGIPRIRATSWEGGQQPYCASWWLDRLSRDPGLRYVAAGHPGTVTFPAHLMAELAPGMRRLARPYAA